MKNIIREKIESFLKEKCVLADDKDKSQGFITEDDKYTDEYDIYFDNICNEYYLFDYNNVCYYTLKNEDINNEQKLIRKILIGFSRGIGDLSTDEIDHY